MTREEALGHSKRVYTDKATGECYPLFEADYDWAFTVYKKDVKKSVIGDPYQCIEAKGACRLPNVVSAFIGCGKDAYLVFGPTSSRPFEHAVHYTIPEQSCRVRDAFDKKDGLMTQVLHLRAPTSGRTLDHRSKIGRRRRDEIKAGTGKPVKPRGKQKAPRIIRLGVPRRPKARIEVSRSAH